LSTDATASDLPAGYRWSTGRRSIKDQVIGTIVDALRGGAYGEGGRLPAERTLATQIGVSRAIVSVAIDELVELGVLESRRGRGGGTFLVSLAELPSIGDRLPGDRRDVMTWLIEAREPIELALAMLVSARSRAGDLRELRAAYGAMVEARDQGPAYSEAALRFNMRLAEAADNPMLREIVRQLVNEQAALRREFSVVPTTEERDAVLAAHARLLDAMESGETRLIASAVAEHMSWVRRIYLRSEVDPLSPGFVESLLRGADSLRRMQTGIGPENRTGR
jgi:GntR family transcriptional repressor for pyruvate dehydrogenase complex